jgi:hypothetical protein
MSEPVHDYKWARGRMHEEVELVRSWLYIRYVYGNAPEGTLKLLAMDDFAIWAQWRDFKDINELLDHRMPWGSYWPSPLDVAEGMLAPLINAGRYVPA